MALNLTQGTPFVTIFRFTLPVIAGNLFQLFYTIVDSIIVGQALGADALAAVGATSIIIGFIICFIQGYTGGFGAFMCGFYRICHHGQYFAVATDFGPS